MAIPSTFRAKYSLDKENYAKADVDAALSDLFAVSKKLAEDNAIKKNTIEQLSKDYSTASVRAQTLENEVRRILAENEQIIRKNNFLEAENKSLKEKIDNIRKNPPVSYEYEMIQKSVSATAQTAEKLLAVNTDLNSRVEELEYRLDSLVSCFYGAGNGPSVLATLREETSSVSKTADCGSECTETDEAGSDADTAGEDELEIEIYEIPDEVPDEPETAPVAEQIKEADEPENVPAAEQTEASAGSEPKTEEVECPAEPDNVPAAEQIKEAAEPEKPEKEEENYPAVPVIEEIKTPEVSQTPGSEDIAEQPTAGDTPEETTEPGSIAADNELVSKIRQSLSSPVTDNSAHETEAAETEKTEEPVKQAEPVQKEKTAAEDRRMDDMMSRLAAIRKKLEEKS